MKTLTTHWLYRATQSKLDHIGTIFFANRGALVRTAHNQGNRHRASNVNAVAFGDVLHFYYLLPSGKASVLGAFEIVEPAQHRTPGVFGHRVDGTAMHVIDTTFIRSVDTAGAYEPDPVLGKFTGWLLRRVGTALPYDATRFPGRSTLVRLERELAAA